MTTAHDFQLPPVARGAAKFPLTAYPSASAYFDAYTQESARAARSIEPAALDHAATILLDAYTRGAGVFSCGNGGSASIANHLQCDHVKGIRAKTLLMPQVVSLSANVELLTAIANDMTYEDIFTCQLQSQAKHGDVLIAISSSGRSPNIIRALTWARDHGLKRIALAGFDGGQAKEVADVTIHVDGANYGVVEDLHQAVMHALAHYICQSQMSPDAICASVF
jgi:D-sedoheptulose 7-phosphate isomerase/D-glycero-D-manno-heptose 1,7-bisphosphate phosphatase